MVEKMKTKGGGLLSDFKKFALKGNVMDLAVGVIIGAAFGKIVSSLVADIFMPLIGLLTGGVNVSGAFFSLDGARYASLEAAQAAGAPTLNYGVFCRILSTFFWWRCAYFCLRASLSA